MMFVLLAALAVASPPTTLADGTAADALVTFEGERVVLTTKDERTITGTLKKVTSTTVVVLSDFDGTVIAVRPVDVASFRVIARSGAVATPAAPALPGTNPSVQWIEINPSLRAIREGDGTLKLELPNEQYAAGCMYLLDNEAGAIRLDPVPTTTAGLVVRLPPGSALQPKRKNRITGCSTDLKLSEGDVYNLNRLRGDSDRKVAKQPMRRISDSSSSSSSSSRGHRDSPQVAEPAQNVDVYADADWDRNAAIVCIAGAGALSAVASIGVVVLGNTGEGPGNIELAGQIAAVTGVTATVLGLVGVVFGIKSYFEYEEVERGHQTTRD
jgi:hypothetical protein